MSGQPPKTRHVGPRMNEAQRRRRSPHNLLTRASGPARRSYESGLACQASRAKILASASRTRDGFHGSGIGTIQGQSRKRGLPPPASLAWKRSAVRFRPGPPSLTDEHLSGRFSIHRIGRGSATSGRSLLRPRLTPRSVASFHIREASGGGRHPRGLLAPSPRALPCGNSC
jgi:hypothetical protein